MWTILHLNAVAQLIQWQLRTKSMSRLTRPRHEWIKTLPASEMVYPDNFTDRIKYYFWRLYAPYHPTVRDGVIALSIMKNRGRQPFLLGTLAPDISVEEFVSFLVEKGYAYHRVAW